MNIYNLQRSYIGLAVRVLAQNALDYGFEPSKVIGDGKRNTKDFYMLFVHIVLPGMRVTRLYCLLL